MSNIKIHEIAKKLNINSKDVLNKAKDLGFNVKSHLSAVSEEDAQKIIDSIKNNNLASKEIKKENKEKNNKKDKGNIDKGHVIIRREVIIADEEDNKKEMEKKETKVKNDNFKEENRKKNFNIVYRNKTTRPLTASELFGLKENKKEEVKVKEEETKKIEEAKKEEIKKEVKTNENNIIKEENKGQKKNMNIENNKNDNFVRKNNNFNNKNNNSNNNFNKMKNRNNNNSNGYNNNRRNNNSNNQYNNRRRVLDEKGIEKNIKNIMLAENQEKDIVREYSNKAIDKQKNNRNDDKNRKPQKNKKSNNYEFSDDKLKSLKQESKLSNMFREGSMLDYYDLGTNKVRKNKKKNQKVQPSEDRVKQKIFKLTEITIPETITVKDLAAELKKTSSEVIKKLLSFGILATINNVIDFDTAYLVASEFGVTAKKKEVIKEEDILFDESEDKEEELISRPPVIVVMGHVDHGKTSLLDAIRSTNVIQGEAGGITQHIGAYKVDVNGRSITFLDTPGHEAFTNMRARGAQITDIAILVVAANDGVMPQTVEAINHAKAAGIPIVVAINKIDLESANVERVKQELSEYGLIPEEWGGDTIYVPISARNHQNIDTLLEMVLLQADMLDLKVNPHKQAKGTVIEAKLDKSKGVIASMLVQRGKLDVGDTIVVGSVIGRIRAMTNDKGQRVKTAGPSTPVEITGLPEVPTVGDTFYEVKDEKMAKHLIERRKRQQREKELNKTAKVTLDDLFNQIEKGNLKQLNLIVKADVQGSVEAVKQSLEKLSNDEVVVKVIHSIAFNVRPNKIAKEMAEKDGVEIKTYSVIYNAIEDVELAMKGMRDPEYKEVIIGNAEIRQTFKVSNVGTIAGCYVTDGKIARNSIVRVIRDDVVIYEGKLISLKRFKDDVKEVTSGYECGIQLENYNDLKVGDVLEAHIMEEIK